VPSVSSSLVEDVRIGSGIVAAAERPTAKLD
jgi:hypothetical protein